MKQYIRLLSFLFVLTLYSCGSDRLDVDVSKIEIPSVRIYRYDSVLAKADTNDVAGLRARLRKEYGAFSDAFFQNVICNGYPDSLMCDAEIRRMLGDKDLLELRKECLTRFTDLSVTEKELTEAFRYFRYHFPKRALPRKVCAVNTNFNFSFVHTEGVYGISLEYFLGTRSKWYDAIQQPMFKRVRYNPEYIPAGFVRGWLLTEFPYNSEKNDVLNRIIYEGKLLYVSRALLRDTHDSVLTGYSQRQLDWCEASEGSIWAAMIEKKLIYSETEDDLNHMTAEAPFTAGFPRESPGAVGRWTGWRIVQAYMERNPQTTLEQLMGMNDAQIILNKSKYKPKL
ncbi:MAG: hypothetical protein MUC87_10515 [Bacteroidia bacterium]|jgi:hypothetical protein|nr:hypothetical protein [Bacteroidia bacterium]